MSYSDSCARGAEKPSRRRHQKASSHPRCLFFSFSSGGHAVSIGFWRCLFCFFLHDSFGSYSTVAFKNVLSFMIKRRASELCSCNGIYLLSVRMNKAFHHLAAVLEWALDETPPLLAPRSPVQGGSGCFTLRKNPPPPQCNFSPSAIFPRWGTFERFFFAVRWWPVVKVI